MTTRRKDRTGGLMSSTTLTRGIGRDGTFIPSSAPEEEEWEVVLEFEEVGGRLYPSRLELRPGVFQDGLPPGGITARLLHAIKVGALVDEFNRQHEGNLAAQELFFGRTDKPTYELPPPSNRPRPKGWGEIFYQDIALHYLETIRTDPRRPIAAMTPRYPGFTRANIRDWVATARHKGYLSPPGRGLAGGRPTDKLVEALRARGVSVPRKKKRGSATSKR
jgi:hypothetical protein